MTYNVENLFDDVDNGSEYSEYRVTGSGWSQELYHKKLAALARVIRESTPGGADLLALQEVENPNALEQLQQHLAGMGYIYAVMVPVKGSATNVAFLSRSPLLYTKAHHLRPTAGHPLRNILEIKLEYRGCPLYVFNNHWKSKSGGEAETENRRIEAAALLKQRILEILKQDPEADIVITGDLNENVSEYAETGKIYQTALIPESEPVPGNFSHASLFLTSNPTKCGNHGEKFTLFEPWFQVPQELRGNYYYRGHWHGPDHILLTKGLFDQQGFTYQAFRVVREPFLLHPRTGNPLGWRSDGSGYSDHLPLLIELILRL